MAKAQGSGGLIAVDEAQELSEKALDEIRSWHDKTGIGIALVGDERVIGRLGGIRRAELGRLHSRISMRHTQAHPKPDDADVIIAGWGVTEPAQCKFLRGLLTKPGGLRGIAKTIKLAGLMAAGEDRAVSLADLQEAWAQRNTETMGA
jgi:DNA transposition AAA+ family ATPase